MGLPESYHWIAIAIADLLNRRLGDLTEVFCPCLVSSELWQRELPPKDLDAVIEVVRTRARYSEVVSDE